ncbi:WD40-repeat-containing domain protein [Pelagophyceae sp. CCMP2097]|nr:WD40-repeat-containing domain protein [Pelagophyceae sp. CCMP2097]
MPESQDLAELLAAAEAKLVSTAAQMEELTLKCRRLEAENDDLAFTISTLNERSAAAGDAAPAARPPADDGAPPIEYAQLFVHGAGLQTLEKPTLAIGRAGGDSNCVSVALRPRSALGRGGDDSSVAVGGADNMIRLFHGATLMGTAQCAAPPITIAWEPTVGRRLAAGCMDGSVGIYDVNGEDDINAAFTCTSTLKHHTKFVVDCQWSRDGRVLATSARDGSVVLCRAQGPGGTQLSKVHTFVLPANPECCAFVDDATLAVSVRSEPFIRYIDLETLAETRVSLNNSIWDTHSSFDVLRLVPSADRKFLLAATDKHKHVVYSVRDHKHVRILVGHASDEYSNTRAAWIDNDGVVVSTSKDNSLHQWCFASGKPLGTVLRAHQGQIRDLDARGGVVATASFDKTVRLWEPCTPTRLAPV